MEEVPLVEKFAAEARAYRKIAHEQGVRSGWLHPANGSSWAVLDETAKQLVEQSR